MAEATEAGAGVAFKASWYSSKREMTALPTGSSSKADMAAALPEKPSPSPLEVASSFCFRLSKVAAYSSQSVGVNVDSLCSSFGCLSTCA